MSNVLIVVGNPTAGERNGTLVSQGTGTSPAASATALQLYTDAEGEAIRCGIRTINGKARPGSCTIELSGTNADKWALAPDSNGQPGAWGAWGAPLVVSDLVALNQIFWLKPRILSTETMPFGLLEWSDVSVRLRTPDDAVDAALINAAPYFDDGPRIISLNEAGFTIYASHTDPDNDVVTGKYIVKTNDTAPIEADWDAAAAFVEPSQIVDGLPAATDHYVWVRITDGTHTVTSGPILASTLEPGANEAPTFTTAPRIKSGSVTGAGFIIEMAYMDAESDPITVKLSTNGGAYATVNPVLNTATNMMELAFTGLLPGTDYTYRVRLEDQWNESTDGTTSELVSVSTLKRWDFNEQAGTAPDDRYFTPKVYGGGSVATDGSGHMKIDSIVADDLAALTWKEAISKSVDQTFKFKSKTSGSTSNLHFFALLAQESTGPSRDVGPATNRMLFLDIVSSALRLRRITAAGTNEYFDASTSTWGTTSVTIPITAGEYITSQIQFSATQGVKVILTNSANAVIATTAWMGWATLLQSANPLWLTIGDTYSGTGLELGYGIVLVDSYEVY